MVQQAIVIVSLTEQVGSTGALELHIVAHRGDNQSFRILSERGEPLLLDDFGGRSIEFLRDFFLPGKTISAMLKPVDARFQSDDPAQRRTDMALVSLWIAGPRKVITPPITASKQSDEVEYNAGAAMDMRPAKLAQYRAAG